MSLFKYRTHILRRLTFHPAFGLVVMASLSLRLPLNPYTTTTWFFYAQAGANSLTTLLIVLRISYHQRHMRCMFGQDYGSLYTKIMTMCVESSLLIVVCIIIANGMGNRDGDFIPVKLTVHIEVSTSDCTRGCELELTLGCP